MLYIRNLVKTLFALAAVTFFLGVGPASSATLIGDTVTLTI